MHTTTSLSSRANRALRENPIGALRCLRIEETADEVVIHGFVSSYYLKQLAQEAVLPVLGERALLNLVTVIRR